MARHLDVSKRDGPMFRTKKAGLSGGEGEDSLAHMGPKAVVSLRPSDASWFGQAW